MSQQILIERLFEALVAGDRPGAREIVAESLGQGASATVLVTDLFWPTYELVEDFYRKDKLTRLSYRMATRLLRVLQDQVALRLDRSPTLNRSVLAICGPSDADELGGQMAVDLLEAGGFTVAFPGGGLPTDEVMAHVHENQPDVLLMFVSSPSDLPEIRSIIDSLHKIGACPNLQIIVGGGVFARADGLAEEIGADLWSDHPLELVEMMREDPEMRATADQRTVGRNRKLRSAA